MPCLQDFPAQNERLSSRGKDTEDKKKTFIDV